MDKIISKYNSKLIVLILTCTGISFLLSLAALQVFTALIIILWLTESWKAKKQAFGKLELLFLVFVIFRIISVAVSEFPAASLQSLYKDALFYIGLFPFSFYFKALTAADHKKIISIFINAAVLVSIIGLVIFNLGIKDRAASITSGYATYSTYLLIALALIFITYNNSTATKKYLWAVQAGIIFTGIVAALSRADLGIAALVFIAGAFIVKIRYSQIAVFLGVVVILSFISFSNNSTEAKGRIEKPTTLSDRDIIWGTALEHAGEHPVFGFGPRTFQDVFNHRDKLTDKGVGGWHNDYITIYIESGCITLLSFLILVVFIFTTGFGKIKNKEWKINSFEVLVLLSITGMLLSAAMSGFITNPILSILFTFLLAIYSAQYSKEVIAVPTIEPEG